MEPCADHLLGALTWGNTKMWSYGDFEPQTSCMPSAGNPSTGVPSRRSPSRSVPARPARSAPPGHPNGLSPRYRTTIIPPWPDRAPLRSASRPVRPGPGYLRARRRSNGADRRAARIGLQRIDRIINGIQKGPRSRPRERPRCGPWGLGASGKARLPRQGPSLLSSSPPSAATISQGGPAAVSASRYTDLALLSASGQQGEDSFGPDPW